MSPHDPTDSSTARHGDDPSPAPPPHPAAEALGPADPHLARATPSATEPIREPSATVGFPDTGTIDHPAAGLTTSSARTLPSADQSDAPAMPTVPGYDLLALLGEGGMGVV